MTATDDHCGRAIPTPSEVTSTYPIEPLARRKLTSAADACTDLGFTEQHATARAKLSAVLDFEEFLTE